MLHRALDELRQLRTALSATPLTADAVARHVSAQPDLREPGYVAGYWAVGGEVPLHAVQLRLAPAQVWCLPVLQADGSLRFAPWRAGDPLVNNRFGIPEPEVEPASTLPPEAMSVVLVPLVGFDRAGNRLGMGGGYYDRAFAFRRAGPGPLLVGVGYGWQALDAPLEAMAWDVPLDAVVTEHGFRRFGR